jgi:hypothetical protein
MNTTAAKQCTIREILELFASFKSLNGRNVIVTSKDGQRSNVVEPYVFDGKTNWNLSKNLGVLKGHVGTFEESQARCVESHKDDAALAKAMDEILDAKVTLDGMLKVKLSALDLDRNNIPPGTLTAIADFIEDDTNPAK